MSEIRRILADLGEVPGIKGTTVLTIDGIMVASTLGPEFIDDVVAGLASFLVSTTRRSLQDAQMGRFSRFILNATHGKMILVDLEQAFLVAIVEQSAELQRVLEKIQEAADLLRTAARIQV